MRTEKDWPLIAALLALTVLATVAFYSAGFLQSMADILAFVQAAVAVLLVPIAIIGFSMARDEFRKAQRTPILHVRCDVHYDSSGRAIRIDPVMTNTGDDMANWFTFTLLMPANLCAADRRFKPISGQQGDWRVFLRTRGDKQIEAGFTFINSAVAASYTGYELVLAEIPIAPDNFKLDECEATLVLASPHDTVRTTTQTLLLRLPVPQEQPSAASVATDGSPIEKAGDQ